MSENFKVSSFQDLRALQEKLLNGEDIIVDEVSNITHTIKLSGGRFENYDINYINADIAKIILSYQKSFDKIVLILKKDFEIEIKANKLISFKLEQGSLNLASDLIKEIVGVIAVMDSRDKKQVLIAIVMAILVGFSLYTYLSHLQKAKNIDAEIENRRIIAKLATNEELQNAINEPKKTVAKSLQDGESATFNDDLGTITKDDTNKYEFRDLIDTSKAFDIIDEFYIYGFEITSDKKRKFKLKVDDKLRWVFADIIGADERIALAGTIEKNQAIKLKLRVIKEYDKVKEIQILDVLKDENEWEKWEFN